MAFAGSGVTCEQKTLPAIDEVQFRKLHDLGFVYASLKDEVEVGQELSLWKPCLLDSAFDTALNACLSLDPKHPLQKLRGERRIFSRFG